MRQLRLLFLIVLAFSPLAIKAQSYQVRLHGVDMSDEKLQALLKTPATFSAQTEAFSYIQQMVPRLQEQGYLTASVDSLIIKDLAYDCYVFIGQPYQWARLSFNALPPVLMTVAAINPAQWTNRPLSPKNLSRLTETILTWCDNNGFPFARIRLDSVQVSAEGGVYANLVLEKGPLRKIDSVVINGSVRISKNYLMRYLDIHEGGVYNEAKLKLVSPRLRELPFLQEAAPWSVGFKLSRTALNLNLKERPANQFNAIIGLLPNSEQTGKFLLTIDALFAFQNILGHGESLSLTMQKLQYKSFTIKADGVWPYLLNTAIGAEAHFNYYRKDTTFQNIDFQGGGRYQFNASDYLKVFYEHKSNNLIYVDTASVRANRKLPDNIDVSANGAGMELVINRTDYRLNPRKGWQVRLLGNALLRKVRRSDAVTGIRDGTGFDYGLLYDSLEQNNYQYHLDGEAAYYFPLGKKATFKTAYAGGWISGERLFQNELYQVGGFKLLRGFDEQSIFTNQYHVLTLELRLLLSRTSNVYFFSDNGWVQSHINGSGTEGLYNGFGIGTTLETKTGIFTISYALGRSDGIPLQVRQSKIHFGYVASF